MNLDIIYSEVVYQVLTGKIHFGLGKIILKQTYLKKNFVTSNSGKV